MVLNLMNYLHMLEEENNINIYKSALEKLKLICDNLINFPNDNKYKKISVGSKIVTEQLLPALGAVELLFEMGFVEDGEHFILPRNVPFSKLEQIQSLLNEKWRKFSSLKSSRRFTNIKNSNSFFDTINECFADVLRYEDEELQDITKSYVPIVELQIRAIKKLRKLQKNTKVSSKINESDLSFDEFLLAEITHWFKNEFFEWMNSPSCQSCSKNCSFNRNESSTDPRISRIEVHKCNECQNEEKFPRYTDPKILLFTRKGRCGEWANTFTLICRTFGFDARIVFDKTDHVWTEVWSPFQKRWIHVDPCEDVIDRPLLYEKGWKKKLTYIIAYSKYEVQDVTWRYVKNYSEVLKRRNLCTEQSLVDLISKLNEERQFSLNLSITKKQYILKRRLGELIELLHVPFPKNESDDDEYSGRISGDAAWRLIRGEISETPLKYVWKVPTGIYNYSLKYNIVKDVYEIYGDNKLLESKENWYSGVYNCKGGIHRKLENDWKIMYLARAPKNEIGEIIWSVEMIDNVTIKSFELSAKSITFDTGKIEWIIQGLKDSVNGDDEVKLTMSIPDCTNFQTHELKGVKKINVIAKLSGGSGDVSWQHAQIFRQNFNSTEHSLSISILINNKSS